MRWLLPLLCACSCTEPPPPRPMPPAPAQQTAPAPSLPKAELVDAGLAADASADASPPPKPMRASELVWLESYAFRGAERSVKVGKISYGLHQLDDVHVAVDRAGDVFLGTPHRGSIDFGGGPLVNRGATGLALAKLAPDGHHLWSHAYPDKRSWPAAVRASHGPPESSTIAALLATPEGGATLIAQASPGLNPGRATPRRLSLSKSWSFALELDAAGKLTATRELSETWEFLRGAARTGDALLIAGTFSRPTEGPALYPGYIEFDGRVTRDERGKTRWNREVRGIEGQDLDAVAVDRAGNVFAVGSAYGSAEIGGETLSGALDYDVLVTKLSPDGTPIWSKLFAAPGSQNATGVAVDPDGNVVFIAMLQDGSVDFGGGAVALAGIRDAVVVKLSPSGEHVFTRRFGARGYVDLRGIAIDAKGEIALAGEVQAGRVELGDSVVETQQNAGDFDGFVVKLTPSGDVLWARAFAGAGEQRATSVASDANGNVLVAGYSDGLLVSGDRNLPGSEPMVFVAKLAP